MTLSGKLGVVVLVTLLGALQCKAADRSVNNAFVVWADAANDGDSLQKAELGSEWVLSSQLDERWRFTSAVRARFDPQDEIEPGQPDQRERSNYNRRLLLGNTGEVELRDFYVDGALGPVTLRVGKQQVVWGQADSLRVLDVVNPHSFREFVLPKPEDRRIPLWTVNMEAPLGGALLQLLWLPDPTYDEIPLDDEPFAVTSPLFVPRAPAGVPTTVAPLERPHGLFESSDAGARLSGFLGGWDLSVNYFHHYNDDPVPFITLTPTGVVVRPRYERTQLLGGSFSNAFGRATVRGEAAYSTDRWFLTRDQRDDDKVFRSDELAWVLGVDTKLSPDAFVSLQYYESRLATAATGATRDAVERQATLVLEQRFANDSFVLRALCLKSLNRGDGAVQAQVDWRTRSNLTVRLAIERFYGDPNGIFGEFREASRARVNVEFAL